jgi:hypothetical protein
MLSLLGVLIAVVAASAMLWDWVRHPRAVED